MVLLEFTVEGPPVSHQTSDKATLQAWKKAVRDEATKRWTSAPETGPVKFILMNFHEGPKAPLEDDNMAKPIRDGLNGLVYQDDKQITHAEHSQTSIDALFQIRGVSWVLLEAFHRGVRRSCTCVSNRPRLILNFPGEAMNIEQAVAQVAEKYRREGYQVIPHPEPDQVPPFAQGHEIDLVAFRDGEKVLVEVKVSREDLQKDAQLLQMAEAVNGQPGWRLDLVVLNADAPAYQVSPDALEPRAEDIRRNLDQAEHLVKTKGLPVAVVMSWAALEAAMRLAARRTGIEPGNGAPSFLLGALYAQGPLHREEFDRLNEAMKVRNALVHGMTVSAIDPSLPQYIIAVARRLLSQNGSAPNS
jgi:hypothetical protein